MLFQTACHTDQGPVRSSNQDAYTVKTVRSKGEEIALAAICDGMGGLAQGEVASARMVRGVEAWFRQAAPAILAGRLPEGDLAAQWTELVQSANQAIFRYGQARGARLGTTVTVLLLAGGRDYLLHVGDCRVYRITAAEVLQLTEDETLAAQELRSGRLTEAEYLQDSRKNILLQCVGAGGVVTPTLLAEPLTEEEAAGLSEFAGKLFNYANSEDSGIAYKIHALLLDYARLKQDDRAIIRELYWAGVTIHYMNVRSDDSSINPLGKQVRGYFQEGASYMARYEGFDLETKSYIIRCLGNSRMAMSRHSHADCEAYMEVFDKAMGVIRSPYYRKLDPSIPWDQFEYAMHADRMTLLAYLRDFKDPEIAEKVLESAEYIHREQAKNQTDDERLQNWRLGYFYAMARYHAGRCPAREVVDVLLEAIEKADPKDYSPTGINNNLTSLSCLFYYEAALSPNRSLYSSQTRHSSVGAGRPCTPHAPPEEKPQYACRLEKMFSKSVSYLNDLPVNQYPRVASNAVRELVEMQAGAERPYRKNMLVYMLAAHKPTYVHSLMVANLTRFFVRRLLWKKPEAMVGTMGYDTVEAVRQHAEELCVMAYECGVYHDIGKSMVTMYVGNNSRRLLDEEFVCVQWHAAFGYELLCKIGHKDDLALAALYHHTYYDGQGGYPKDQPPCPKNMKPIVDALTVADSLDAATDNIGRCYTAAKPLEKLIEELRAQKGSRYAPAVVELFDDPDFCTEFRRKLYESRQSVYLEVYRETI